MHAAFVSGRKGILSPSTMRGAAALLLAAASATCAAGLTITAGPAYIAPDPAAAAEGSAAMAVDGHGRALQTALAGCTVATGNVEAATNPCKMYMYSTGYASPLACGTTIMWPVALGKGANLCTNCASEAGTSNGCGCGFCDGQCIPGSLTGPTDGRTCNNGWVWSSAVCSVLALSGKSWTYSSWTGPATPSCSATPTPSQSPTKSGTRTVTASPTITNTATGSRTATRSTMPTPSGTVTATPSATMPVTGTRTRTGTASAATTPSSIPSRASTMSATGTAATTPTAFSTVTGSATPAVSTSETATPSASATVLPSASESSQATAAGTATATPTPSAQPSGSGSGTTLQLVVDVTAVAADTDTAALAWGNATASGNSGGGSGGNSGGGGVGIAGPTLALSTALAPVPFILRVAPCPVFSRAAVVCASGNASVVRVVPPRFDTVTAACSGNDASGSVQLVAQNLPQGVMLLAPADAATGHTGSGFHAADPASGSSAAATSASGTASGAQLLAPRLQCMLYPLDTDQAAAGGASNSGGAGQQLPAAALLDLAPKVMRPRWPLFVDVVLVREVAPSSADGMATSNGTTAGARLGAASFIFKSAWGSPVNVTATLRAACTAAMATGDVNVAGNATTADTDCAGAGLAAMPRAAIDAAVQNASAVARAALNGRTPAFALTLAGAAHIVLVADDGGAAEFVPGASVTLGDANCTVLWAGSSGRLLHVRTPELVGLCATSSRDVTAGDDGCGYAPLSVSLGHVPSTLLASSFGAARADSLTSASVQAVSCPPFCPNAFPGTVPYVPPATAALSGAISPASAAAVPAYPARDMASLPVPAATAAQLVALRASTGVFVTRSCVAQGYTDPSTGDCTDPSSSGFAGCAFGPTQRSGAATSGGTVAVNCIPCSAISKGAMCPGGARAWPAAGYFTSSERSGAITPCAPPSAARCLGWNATTSIVECGPGYLPGSYGCLRCASRFYIATDGSCAACPVSTGPWAILRPLLVFLACLLAVAAVLYGSLLAIAKVVGGTVRNGVRRMLEFLSWAVTTVQVVSQVGQAATPSLPPFAKSTYAVFNVFQFADVVVPAACMATYPFAGDVATMTIALALLVVAALLNGPCARWRDKLSRTHRETGTRSSAVAFAAAPDAPASTSARSPVGSASSASVDEPVADSDPMPLAPDAPPRRSLLANLGDPIHRRLSQWRLGAHRGARPSSSGDGSTSGAPRAAATKTRALRLYNAAARLCFAALLIVYPMATNSALRAIACDTVTMTVREYALLDNDGSSAPAPLRSNPNAVITVQLLNANPSFVCYEGLHTPLGVLGWLTLFVFALGYPVASFVWAGSRLKALLTAADAGASWSKAAARRTSVLASMKAVSRLQPAVEALLGPLVVSSPRWLWLNLCGFGATSAHRRGAVDSPAARGRRLSSWKAGRAPLAGAALSSPTPNTGIASPTAVVAATSPLKQRRVSVVRPLQLGGDNDAVTMVSNPLAQGAPSRHKRATLIQSASPVGQPRKSVASLVGTSPPPGLSALPSPESRLSLAPTAAGGTTAARGASAGPALTTDSAALRGDLTALQRLQDSHAQALKGTVIAPFALADYRVSMFWFRHVDMVTMLMLSLVLVFMARPVTSGAVVGKLLLTLLIVSAQLFLYWTRWPYNHVDEWKQHVQSYILLLTAAAAVLNSLAGLKDVGAGQYVDDAFLFVFAAFTTMLSIGAFAILIAAFAWSMIEGARREQLRLAPPAAQRLVRRPASSMKALLPRSVLTFSKDEEDPILYAKESARTSLALATGGDGAGATVQRRRPRVSVAVRKAFDAQGIQNNSIRRPASLQRR